MNRIKKSLTYMAAIIFVVLWIFPVVWLLLSSFKDGSELFRYPLTFFPEIPTLDNYKAAIEQFDFLRYTANTAFITIVATLITILMSCMCGYALAKYHYKWLNILFLALLSTTMLPTEVIMRPSFTILYKLGLDHSLWAASFPRLEP